MTDQRRKPPGRWKKGESGNPSGRKPGTGEVARIRAAIADKVPAILESLLARALEGDTGAARLLLERDILALLARFNRGGEQALRVPGSYLEVVVTRS